MGNNRKNDNLGDQILNVVDEILESGEFQKLNSVVSETVSMALEEARKQLEMASKRAETATKAAAVSRPPQTPKGAEVRPAQTYKAVSASRARIKKVGSVASVLFQVFGGIGTGIFGIMFLIGFLVNIGGEAFWPPVIFFGILFAISLAFIYIGAGKRARLKRAERYQQVMQGKAYINIFDLALLTNKREEYVRKDVRKMIETGIFPEGHLDAQETCLIIGDVAYREYIRMEKSRKAIQAEIEEQKRIEAESAAQAVQAENENAELNAMIQEGNSYIKQLRDLNDVLDGEVISTKLFRLENILKEIFEQLKEHPEQMPEMHKFMEYYLPTTLKLVTAYEEFDRVSVAGEDMLASKKEIEKTLDTINTAFEELLNKLFRARVYDVTTDAQVLKTMLAREGLTKEPVFAERAAGEEQVVLQRELK